MLPLASNQPVRVSRRMIHSLKAEKLILHDPWMYHPCQERNRPVPEAPTDFQLKILMQRHLML